MYNVEMRLTGVITSRILSSDQLICGTTLNKDLVLCNLRMEWEIAV